jgi:hypothetical protein
MSLRLKSFIIHFRDGNAPENGRGNEEDKI